jgi:hypothetical protein
MAADVEQEVLVTHSATDAADIDWNFLDHGYRLHLVGQAIGGGETRGPSAYYEHFKVD